LTAPRLQPDGLRQEIEYNLLNIIFDTALRGPGIVRSAMTALVQRLKGEDLTNRTTTLLDWESDFAKRQDDDDPVRQRFKRLAQIKQETRFSAPDIIDVDSEEWFLPPSRVQPHKPENEGGKTGSEQQTSDPQPGHVAQPQDSPLGLLPDGVLPTPGGSEGGVTSSTNVPHSSSNVVVSISSQGPNGDKSFRSLGAHDSDDEGSGAFGSADGVAQSPSEDPTPNPLAPPQSPDDSRDDGDQRGAENDHEQRGMGDDTDQRNADGDSLGNGHSLGPNTSQATSPEGNAPPSTREVPDTDAGHPEGALLNVERSLRSGSKTGKGLSSPEKSTQPGDKGNEHPNKQGRTNERKRKRKSTVRPSKVTKRPRKGEKKESTDEEKHCIMEWYFRANALELDPAPPTLQAPGAQAAVSSVRSALY
jgi:hypothetical protein